MQLFEEYGNAESNIVKVENQPKAEDGKYKHVATAKERNQWHRAETGKRITVFAWHTDNVGNRTGLTQYAKDIINRDTLWGNGWYGSRDPDIVRTVYGEGDAEQYEVTLNNPYVIKSNDRGAALKFKNEDLQKIRSDGYDGIIVKPIDTEIGLHDRGGIELVVFR